MNESIYHDSLVKQLQKALDKYQGQIEDTVGVVLESSAKRTVEALKKTSPKSKGSGKHYANGWTFTTEKSKKFGYEVVVYNKTKPQLTHLLNDGFTMRNGQRKTGDGHIDQAEEIAISNLEEGLKELQ